MAVLWLSLLAGCAPSDDETPLTLEDLRLARNALPLSEVSLQLRIGSTQPAIVEEIQRRHLAEPLDAATEDQLLQHGGGPDLIAALKNKDNLLTAKQKKAFDQEASERAGRAQQVALERENEQATFEAEQAAERQRRQQLLAQNARNIQQTQTGEDAYWAAQRNYEAQRKSLELRAQSLQTQINYQRSHGYNEAELRVANAALDDVNAQLLHLTPPTR